MSVVDSLRPADLFGDVSKGRKYVFDLLFGDRIGLTLFLGSLLFVATYWRVGVFINDSFTVANALANVADGHLYVDHVVYGPASGATPGMKIHDGRLYGLHYGTVFAALPFLWAFGALDAVADLRIVIVGLWSLGLLAFCLQVGRLLDHRRTAAVAGSLAAIALFVTNLGVATPLDSRWLVLIALQTSTMVWAGLIAVVLYRLTARIYDRRTGAAAGVAVVVATPIGFWASIPKRHVLLGLLALLTVYCFYRSRADPDSELRFRALAYVFVGLSAWVNPLEALLALVALGPLDVLTARSNSPRHLGIVAGAFLVSLLPVFVTNALVTGHPLRPIWFLPSYTGQEQILTGGGGGPTGPGGSAGGGTGGTGGTGGSGTGGATGGTTPGIVVSLLTFVLSVTDAAIARMGLLWSQYLNRGITTILTEPDRLYHTFVHSGYIRRVAHEDGGQAINLALLEAMPLLAALVGLPALGLRAVGDRERVEEWLASPAGKTDLLVGAYVLLITVAYIPLLPLHATVTARYLVPMVPGLVFLVVRLPPVRTAIREAGRTAAFSFATTVLIGGQLVVLGFVVLLDSASRGEAMQLHAWLGLATALPLGTWVLVATITDRDYARSGAVWLGVASGASTVFLVLSGLVYFAYAGAFALPVSQWISDTVSLLG